MREGGFVQIRLSEKLTALWLGFARNGVAMQIRRLTRQSGYGGKLADALSRRQEWFDREDPMAVAPARYSRRARAKEGERLIPVHLPSPQLSRGDWGCGAWRIGPLLPALFVVFVASAAAPADGDPDAGQRLARQVCAECHAVEPDEVALIGPRSFLEVAMDPHTTEPGLRLFLRSPHVFMPNFILTEEQIGDVVAYILSLEVEEATD